MIDVEAATRITKVTTTAADMPFEEPNDSPVVVIATVLHMCFN